MLTNSKSQSGQDRFVSCLIPGHHGAFLDIGANHPIELSNSYSLEKELFWTGLLVERDPHCVELLKQHRASPVLAQDALAVHWPYAIGLLQDFAGDKDNCPIDYLSLDCDENTLAILKRLMEQVGFTTRFRVLTVETDAYRFGPGPRDAIDALLKDYGYDVLCKNVRATDGSIYETWAVSPGLVNMEKAERLRSDGLIWSDILKRA